MSYADSHTQANQILETFSSSCPTQGQWTQAALSYANSLVQVLESVKNDPDCKTISGALSQTQNIATIVSNLSQDPNQAQILSLQKQQQELMLMISGSTNATDIATFNTELQTVNVQLAQYQGLQIAANKFQKSKNQGQALQSLVSGTNTLMQQATQNSSCIQKNPAILPAIAGLAGSIEATLLTGGHSMVVGAAADILNAAIDGIRVGKITRQINRMASSISASAYQCTLETLSNQWCSAQDALDVIKLKGGALTHLNSKVPIQVGIDVLNKDSDIFLNWLQSLTAGTDPNNQAVAAREAEVLDRDAAVKKGRVNGIGIIAQNKDLFNSASTPAEQWTVELQVISSIISKFVPSVNAFTPDSIQSPFQDVFGSNYQSIAPWYLIGVPDSAIPRSKVNGERLAITNYSPDQIVALNPKFRVSLDDLSVNMNAWVSLARERVNRELSQILNLDPLKLIVNAVTPNIDGTSPYQSLQNIIQFMKAQSPKTAVSGSFTNIYSDTLSRLQNISDAIDSVVTSNTDSVMRLAQGKRISEEAEDPSDSKETLSSTAINNIFNYGVLTNGIQFLSDRLKWSIRLSLNHLVTTPSDGVTQSQAAFLLAADDIINEIKANSTGDLNMVARDIQNSQVVIENTLTAFTQTFGRGINHSLKLYGEMAKVQNEDALGTSNQAAAELCMKLLATPEWPRAVSKDFCQGKQLSSIYLDGPKAPMIDQALMELPFRERVCKFRNYNRANYLYQIFQIKQ